MNIVQRWKVYFLSTGTMGVCLAAAGMLLGYLQLDRGTQIGVMVAATAFMVVSAVCGGICMRASYYTGLYKGSFQDLDAPSNGDERRAQQFVVLHRLRHLCKDYLDAHYAAAVAGCFTTLGTLTARQRELNTTKKLKLRLFMLAFNAARFFGYDLPDKPTDVMRRQTITGSENAA